MNSIFKKDLYRYSLKKNKIINVLKALLIPGVVYMYFFRNAQLVNNNSIRGVLYYFVLRRLSFKYGLQIPVSAKIGAGFYIGHFGNIVISPQTIIGKNCNIAHGVTIGAINHGAKKGAPEIGDFVWMGANSIIVGNIKIGSNVLIAPGAFVNFDVPSNVLVIGNPGRIIRKDNPTRGYINNIIE